MKRILFIATLGISLLFCVSLRAEVSSTKASKSALPADNPVALAAQVTGLPLAERVETIPGGKIDWTRGVVYAVGKGIARADLRGAQAEAMAKRGAYIVAARNAALVLAGIRVGPGGRCRNVRNGWIRANVTLTGFREMGATYDPATRTALARLELPLCGIRGAVTVLGLEGQKIPRRWTWPKESHDIPSRIPPYDVIIIDARGLSCRPSVLPRLTTAEGLCVFDGAEALTDRGLGQPPARYATLKKSVNIPNKVSRDHRRCLTLRAQRVSSDGSLVLDQRNLRVLTEAPNARNTLRRGKLVIVTDTAK